jgi:serine/threonine protein kinase
MDSSARERRDRSMNSAASAVGDRVGTVLASKYRLDRVLGEGGMGAVYEAVNTWTERRVAVKLMHGEVARDSAMVERFFREARAAGKVGHRNIVEVLDMGFDDATGAYFLVQEFLDGQSLRDRVDHGGPLPLREVFEVLIPVMEALSAAHRAGVTHRDLKPENIFLQRVVGRVVPKVIDFGIAKVATDAAVSSSLTRTGSVLGTPYYMSPEQARGEKDVGAASDVWAMGVLWFELLAGRYPFDGDNYNALLATILTDAAPALATVAPGLPAPLCAVIDCALKKSRAERFSSMDDFLRALLECGVLSDDPWIQEQRRSIVPALPPAAPSAFSAGGSVSGAGAVGRDTLGRSVAAVAVTADGRAPTRGRAPVIAAVAGVLTLLGITAVVTTRPPSNEPSVTVSSRSAASAVPSPPPAPPSLPAVVASDPPSAPVAERGADAGATSPVPAVAAPRAARPSAPASVRRVSAPSGPVPSTSRASGRPHRATNGAAIVEP